MLDGSEGAVNSGREARHALPGDLDRPRQLLVSSFHLLIARAGKGACHGTVGAKVIQLLVYSTAESVRAITTLGTNRGMEVFT